MGRIYNDYGVAFDFEKIKCINKKNASWSNNGYPTDFYLEIELLYGNEYVFNPDTHETDLIKPTIIINFAQNNSLEYVLNDIIEQWSIYLESKKENETDFSKMD